MSATLTLDQFTDPCLLLQTDVSTIVTSRVYSITVLVVDTRSVQPVRFADLWCFFQILLNSSQLAIGAQETAWRRVPTGSSG